MNKHLAIISKCGLYRYALRRFWSPGNSICTFIMLNPSTADATTDDATIRRCTAFAKSWGFTGMAVANLYAYRATNPRDLWRVYDPVGPQCDSFILHLARQSSKLIAAWGANAREPRISHVVNLVSSFRLHALELTKSGQPKHPLYLRQDVQPFRWPT